MAASQFYEKVAGDESSENLNGATRASRIVRAPPTERKKSSVLTKVAFGAIAVTVFIAVVAIVSTVVVSYKLPAATEAALAKQSASSAVAAVQPSSTSKANHESTIDKQITNTGNATMSLDASPIFDAEHRHEQTNCGSTPDEARAAGCIFDVMMQLWTPPECMDSPLTERFLKQGNWTWYSDSDALHAYTDEEIRKGNHDVVYVALSYHRHSCIFAWERLTRAMRTQSPLIAELISYDYVTQCRDNTMTLIEDGTQQVRGVVAPTGYTKCASYDVWIKNLPLNKMSSIG